MLAELLALLLAFVLGVEPMLEKRMLGMIAGSGYVSFHMPTLLNGLAHHVLTIDHPLT